MIALTVLIFANCPTAPIPLVIAPKIFPSARFFTAFIAPTIGPMPGTNESAVLIIGLLTTFVTVLTTPLTTLLTVLTTPLTALLIPLNIPPKKNSGNSPPSALNHVVGFHHFLSFLGLSLSKLSPLTSLFSGFTFS